MRSPFRGNFNIVILLVILFLPGIVQGMQLIYLVPVEPTAISSAGGGIYYLGKIAGETLVVVNQNKLSLLAGLDGNKLAEYFPEKLYYLISAKGDAWREELPPDAEVLATFGDTYLVAVSDYLKQVVHGEIALLEIKPLPTTSESLPQLEPVKYSDPDIQELVDEVDVANIHTTIQDLVNYVTRYDFTPQCHLCADYLANKLTSYGAAVEKIPFLPGSLQDVFFADDGISGWAVGAYGVIIHTTDGGATWNEQTNPSGDSILSGICFYDSTHGWACGRGNKLLKTDDGGATWVEVNPGYSYSYEDIWADASGKVLACGSLGSIIRSNDFGATWHLFEISAQDNLWSIDMQDYGTRGVVVGKWGANFITSDGGTTWHSLPTITYENLYDVYFESDGTGWVCGDLGTLLKSTDYGESWDFVDGPSQDDLRQVTVFGSRGWVGGLAGTLWFTEDAGDHWQETKIATDSTVNGLNQPQENSAYLVGDQSVIFKYIGPDVSDWENQSNNLSSVGTHVIFNVVGRIDGSSHSHQVYALTAHYDSMSEDPYVLAPGADDNATGVAGVLETCRLLAGESPTYSLEFIAFGGEELGLFGSARFATSIKYSSDTFLGVLNFDMLGCTDDGMNEDLDLISNEQSVNLMDFIISSRNNYVPDCRIKRTVDPSMWRSDHSSFWNQGIPALLGIEDWPENHNRANTTQDTINWINFDLVALFTKPAVSTLAELGQISALQLPGDLANLKVYPNPLNLTLAEAGAFTFDGLPQDSKVKIYNVAGELVAELPPPTSGRTFWYALNRAGDSCASGVYLYVVESGSGSTSGKLALIK